MSLFAKIMIVVNFILAVAFLAAAGTLLGAAEDYKGKYEEYRVLAGKDREDLKKQIDEWQAKANTNRDLLNASTQQKTAIESRVGEISRSNTALETANAELRRSYDKLAAAQSTLQNQLTDLQGQISTAQTELSKAKTDNTAQRDQIRSLQDEVARVTQDKENAEKSLASNEAQMKTISDQLEQNKVTLARYQKEKGSLTAGVTMKDVRGVVQAAKDDLDIYILSVGTKDGVEAGYEFTIYRGNEYISTIVIDKVFPNYSSGMTKSGTKRKPVQAGDEAATRL